MSAPTNRFDRLVVLVGGLVRQWEAVGDFKHPIEVEPKDQSVGIRTEIKTMLDDFRGDLKGVIAFSDPVPPRDPSKRTRPSICTVVIGISASASTLLLHEAGRDSCVGATGAGAAWTVGKEAAIAAAMVAMM